ncbi:MAG: glycosyltransferase family 2 protein [Alphaproteobacteria bacterium]|nr:glycosyltransferase family 2 protein [Alphaproteobacteria bacterium]
MYCPAIMAAPTPEISFAIPCHNEAENLPELVRQIEAQIGALARACEIVIVDDGSDDGSWAVLTELSAGRPHLRALRLARNCGQSAALYTAIQATRGAFVITMDADLQNDPADVPKLLATLVDTDCACGTRQAARAKGDSWLKKTISAAANAVRRKVLGDAATDAGCTYRAFRREAFAGIPFFKGFHRFIPVLMAFNGARVVEVPVGNRARLHGQSHYGLGLLARRAAVIDMIAVRWLKSRLVTMKVSERIGSDPP